MNKKQLYESIMKSVAKEVKKALNESDIQQLQSLFVDLGLPSGTLWATNNEGSGKYYTYGEASQIKDGNLPTAKLVEELFEFTKCQWTTADGNVGMIFAGTNGKKLFIPAGGYKVGENTYDADTTFIGWTSDGNDKYAYCAQIDQHMQSIVMLAKKTYSLQVRLVKQK